MNTAAARLDLSPGDTLAIEAATMLAHEHRRILCPFCYGGMSRELSMDIRKDDSATVRAKCYRASCGRYWHQYGTAAHTVGALSAQSAKKPKAKYRGETFPPSNAVLEMLFDKYRITDEMAEEYDIRMDGQNNIVVPTYSHTGVRNGWVVKFLQPQRTKVLTFTPEGLLGSWYNTRPEWLKWGKPFNDSTLIITEDVLSAMRVNAACHSLALLGAVMSTALVKLLSTKHQYERIVLALDKDAHTSGIRQVQRWGNMLPTLEYALIPKDIKDMSEQEFWLAMETIGVH